MAARVVGGMVAPSDGPWFRVAPLVVLQSVDLHVLQVNEVCSLWVVEVAWAVWAASPMHLLLHSWWRAMHQNMIQGCTTALEPEGSRPRADQRHIENLSEAGGFARHGLQARVLAALYVS